MLGIYTYARACLLFLYMRILVPSTVLTTIESQWEVAQTIATVTQNLDDQALLVKIAQYESGFREEIVHCRKKSYMGASGPWQVVPFNGKEAIRVCSSMKESALMALERIATSRHLCKRFPAPERLIQYAVGGVCNTHIDEGKKLSRQRWATNEMMESTIQKYQINY